MFNKPQELEKCIVATLDARGWTDQSKALFLGGHELNYVLS